MRTPAQQDQMDGAALYFRPTGSFVLFRQQLSTPWRATYRPAHTNKKSASAVGYLLPLTSAPQPCHSRSSRQQLCHRLCSLPLALCSPLLLSPAATSL